MTQKVLRIIFTLCDIIEYKGSSFSYNISLFFFYTVFFCFQTFLSYFRWYIIISFNIKLFFIYTYVYVHMQPSFHPSNKKRAIYFNVYPLNSYVLQINEYIHHKDGNVFPFPFIPKLFFFLFSYTHMKIQHNIYNTCPVFQNITSTL